MHLSILLLQHTPEACPGCFWQWFIWMLAAFALGLGIGKWIWGKYKLLVKEKNKKLAEFKSKNEALEKDFIALKYQINEFEKDNKGLKASLADSESNILALGTQLAKLRQGNKIEKESIAQHNEAISTTNPTITQEKTNVEVSEEKLDTPIIKTEEEVSETTFPPLDTPTNSVDYPISTTPSTFSDYSPFLKNTNLKVIEGIGSKIESILNKTGFLNWKDLANADLDRLQEIMHDAGPRYRIHDPSTWQKQARLCMAKDWQGLINFQQKLFADKTNQEDIDVLTKIEKLVAKKLGYLDIDRNDLKIIEGIGPKIENLLNIGQIKSWEDLAEAPIERLEKILEDGGERFKLAIPTTWPIQAKYALQHDWVKLKKYQEELINGKPS